MQLEYNMDTTSSQPRPPDISDLLTSYERLLFEKLGVVVMENTDN